MTETHGFVGNWTEEKLKRVEKYLKAYAAIMNNQNFRFAYIDSFAGTGYREEKKDKNDGQIFLFQQNDIKEIEAYSKGSARIAWTCGTSYNPSVKHKVCVFNKRILSCKEGMLRRKI